MRVLVELHPSIDGADWAARHARGEVPDRVPYGLDRMQHYGHQIVVREWPNSAPIRLAGRATARAGGRMMWLESRLGRPSGGSAQARLCWDERLAVPDLLRSGGHRTPLVTGVIWLTEPDNGLSGPLRALARKALHRADAIFLASAAQIEPLTREWGVTPSRLEVVNFAIDADFWAPRAEATTGEGTTGEGTAARIVSVGNDRHRDHPLLMSALPDIQRQVPAARLDLVTAQPVDVPAQFGLRHRHLSHVELRRLYQDSTMAVVSTHANIHCSGLTATLEAMAMGRPVVVTNNPGMDEYVEHGRTGLLVPQGDREALTKAIVSVLADPDFGAELGRAAHASIRARFNTERHAADLAALLRKQA